MKKIFLLITSLLYIPLLASDSIVGAIEKVVRPSSEKIFVGFSEQRQKQLTSLKQERDALVKEKEETQSIIAGRLESLKRELDQVQAQLGVQTHNEFLKKKSAILNETYQVVKDLQREREQLIVLLDDFIKHLSDYIADPDFATYKKELKLQDRLSYSFDDLQRLHMLILEQDKRIASLTEQEKNAQIELESRKRMAIASQEAYASKKSELEAEQAQTRLLNAQQEKELFTLEEQLFADKKKLAELQVKEIEYKAAFLSLQLAIAKSQKDILKNYLNNIKPLIRVSQVDIAAAKDDLAKQKQQYYAMEQKYRQEIDQLLVLAKQKQEELELLSKQFDIPLSKELDQWSKEPIPTVDGYVELCKIGIVNVERLTLERKQELLDAQIALQKQILKYKTLEVQAKETYHKITTRKFVTEDEIVKELKSYTTPKAEAQAELTRYKEKLAQVTESLSAQKKILDNIQKHRLDIQRQRDTTFSARPKAYLRCIELLSKAEDLIKEQIDILSTLTGIDSNIIATINNTLRLVNFMIGELESKGIWYRPEGAISWNGVKNIITDIAMFFNDVRIYAVSFNFPLIINQVKKLFDQPWEGLLFALKLLLIIIALIIVKRYLPLVGRFINWISQYFGGFIRFLSLIALIVLEFIQTNLFLVALWALTFAFLMMQDIPDPAIFIFFYLLSIPYLLYLAYRFMRCLVRFNVRHHYSFISADFQRRFYVVTSALLYATIVIFFFREAFMLVNYYRSELPTILLALNFIIFQIALILLIDKQQILGLIPTKNDFWLWVHTQVDTYYYMILLMVIAIIIMSNPFVGYGTLVLYILFGIIYSSLLLIVLFWLHGLLKKIASTIFFTEEDETVKERFPNAKTWFGLTIIASFLLFTFIGIMIGAKIWGWQISFDDAYSLFDKQIMGDAQHPITIRSLIKILGFIFGGYFVAYWLNRFVLDKIFDLLLVEPGVQHTVTSLMQYIIFMSAIFLGLYNTGLDFLVNILVGGLILGLGWILKEPISDFVAYFIILVQRPIKIDDYVQIDNEVRGQVRKITARAVMIRRENSYTIVVPNSYVISRAIKNWNYTRGFIAFGDILLVVEFSVDPVQVVKLLESAMESHPKVLRTPKPVIRLESFNESGFLFLIRGFISSTYTLDQWDIASDIRIAIVNKLREQNIKIAVPIRMILNSENTGGRL